MKEGYKKTTVGEIPDDWEIVQQTEVATFYNGRAYKLTEWEETGTPVIRLQNLTGSGKDYYYSNLNLPDHQYCHNGDLLYMWSATFGPVWWKGEKAIYHYHIWKIDTNENKLSKQFLYYLLDDVTRRMKNESHGSTMLHVTKGGMEKLQIQLPPLPEQQRIAEILSTVDEKIEVIGEQISQTQELKRGLMQRVLTKGIGHTQFKDSPLGRIPESWEVLTAQEANILWVDGDRGTNYPKEKDFSPFGYCLFLSAKNVTKEGFRFTECSFIDAERDSLLRKGKLKRGDIIITTRGTVGNVALFNESVELTNIRINSGMAILRDSKNFYSQDFLFQYLRSRLFQKQVELIAFGSAQPQLTIKELKKALFLKLPLPEQQKIAEILFTVDDKLEVLQDKKQQYQELKRGLMQQLLTGKVRVTNLLTNAVPA